MKKLLAGLLYIIAFITTGMYFYAEFSQGNVISPTDRLFILGIICLLMFIASKILSSKKLMKFNIWFWFILYIILVTTLTLFDSYFNRNFWGFGYLNKKMIEVYLNKYFNIIPFKTINNYIITYMHHNISFNAILYNIIGNLVAFTPCAFFMPMLFKKQNNFFIFLITMIIIVIVIEALQFLTLSGACDIDDLILNVGGASIMFLLLKIKPIRILKEKLFY